jgi:hypothetical protein
MAPQDLGAFPYVEPLYEERVMQANHPECGLIRYMHITVLKWLPKTWVLSLMWKRFLTSK